MSCRLSPRQTGLADFPHPAFPKRLIDEHARNPPFGSSTSGYLGCGLKSVVGRSQGGARSLLHHDSPAGFLRSTGVTRLRRYYEPLRLPNAARAWLFIPMRRCPTAPRRVSQVPDWSVDARRPLSPRRTRPLHMLVASRSISGFTSPGGLAILNCLTRPKPVHGCYG